MCARSVELFEDVHVVKRHAIVDVLCGPVVNVVIGVHIFVLSVPLVVVHVVRIFLAVILYQFIPLFNRKPFFTYVFTVFSRHCRCGIYTLRRLQWTAVSCKRSNCNKAIEFGKIMP